MDHFSIQVLFLKPTWPSISSGEGDRSIDESSYSCTMLHTEATRHWTCKKVACSSRMLCHKDVSTLKILGDLGQLLHPLNLSISVQGSIQSQHSCPPRIPTHMQAMELVMQDCIKNEMRLPKRSRRYTQHFCTRASWPCLSNGTTAMDNRFSYLGKIPAVQESITLLLACV